MDCSLSGFSVHGVLQARILEWVAIPFSRGSSLPRDQTWFSYIAGRHFYHLSHQGSVSYLTRYQARVPCSKSVESQPLDHQGSLKILFIYLLAPCGMWHPSSLTRFPEPAPSALEAWSLNHWKSVLFLFRCILLYPRRI